MIARYTAWALGAVALAALGARAADDVAVPLGQDLAGETCSVSSLPTPGNTSAIACGADVSGSLTAAPLSQVLPADKAARQAAMGEAAKALLASAATNDCGEPLWLDNGDLLFLCT